MKTETKRPEHLRASFEGDLYDDRTGEVIRPGYAIHRREIDTVADLKATLRAGDLTFPGCYEIYFLTTDGALLCPDCVRENFQSCIWSIQTETSDGWRIVGITIDAEMDETEDCSHCGRDCGPERGEG